MPDQPQSKPRGTVAEPFGPGVKMTGLLKLPYLGRTGLFDETSEEATIVEPEDKLKFRGRPNLPLWDLVKYIYSLNESKEKKKADKPETKADNKERKTTMQSYGRDEPIVGIGGNPAYNDFLKLYSKALGEGYEVEFMNGPFNYRGETCDGLREGKKITLNRNVSAGKLAHNLAHELNEDEKYMHRDVCSLTKRLLRTIGASDETMEAADEAERFLKARYDW